MSSEQNARPPCPVCTAGDTAPLRSDVADFEYGVATHRRFAFDRCRVCGSDFLVPRPTVEEIASFYPDDYHAYHDDHSGLARLLVRLRAKARAKYYAGLTPDGTGRLFDVGAGDCRHFDDLKPHCRLEFSGVEIKPEIAAQARARGYSVETGTLEAMDIAPHRGQYDIVSMNHVVEHVQEPRLMLQQAFALLKPGGVALGQLPARDSFEEALAGRYWGGYHFPRHLQCITYAGMRRMLGDCGFTDIEVRSAPHVQAALSLQNHLIAAGWRPRMRHGKTPLYSGLILAVLPFETVAWLAGRGGVMNFVARRPAAR